MPILLPNPLVFNSIPTTHPSGFQLSIPKYPDHQFCPTPQAFPLLTALISLTHSSHLTPHSVLPIIGFTTSLPMSSMYPIPLLIPYIDCWETIQ